MKHFKQTFQLILVSSLLLAIAHSLSKPIALQPDTTYQTGVQTIITTNFTSTAEVVYNIPYTSVMTTSSLNASLGIYGLNYYMINKVFGWKYFVSSLTNVDIIIHLSVYTANSPLYYLKLCYIISSNPDIDMSYVEYTFNRNNLNIQQQQMFWQIKDYQIQEIQIIAGLLIADSIQQHKHIQINLVQL